MSRSSTRLPLRVTAALAAVTSVFALAAAQDVAPDQPPNSIGIRLADVPVDAENDPRARVAVIDHAAPGGRVTRRIDVISTVDQPLTVDVYAGNAQIRDGAFAPDDRERPGVADWVTVDQPSLTIDPMGVRRIDIAIDVPTNAPTGEHYGYVWVEPPSSSGEVSVTNRVGVQILLSVGTGNEPPVDFEIGSLTAARNADGVPVVVTRLRNTGGRALTISGELILTDGPAGLEAGPFGLQNTVTLRPDEIGELLTELDPELPDGPWLAQVTAVAGLLQRTAEAEISFPSAAGQEAPPAESETIGGTDSEGNDISEQIRNQRRMLLPLAAILILLALGALWLMVLWKRREEEEDEDGEEAVAATASTGATDDGG